MGMLCKILMELLALGMQGILTIILLAVLLHVNLVVAFGWLAVGVTVCKGATEGLSCGTALCVGPCTAVGKGVMMSRVGFLVPVSSVGPQSPQGGLGTGEAGEVTPCCPSMSCWA